MLTLDATRVREYAGLARPNYVQGLCGSNESMPMADARFLRLGRWAVVGAASCGNSLLNAGEVLNLDATC